MIHFGTRFSVAVAALGLSAAVLAADADCHRSHDGTAPSAECAAKMAQRVAQHQQKLHDKLKITADQEAAWKTFAAKTAPGAPMPHPGRDEMAKLPAPEHLERMLGMLKEGEARLSARLAAVKEFYAVLTPEQQAIFDEQLRHMMHRRHHRFDHG